MYGQAGQARHITKPEPAWLKTTLKARSVWPQTCLDLRYLDDGPHHVLSLESACPGMSPVTSSLEQQGIIWKGWQNQHTVCLLSPLLFGGLLAPLCVHSIKDPVWDVGLKGGDAQFNQTFGCLSVKMPQFQRNDRLRKTMCWNYPLWSEETSDPCMCACFIFLKTLYWGICIAMQLVERSLEHF